MYFKQMLDERCGCASYLVAWRTSRKAAIIDASIETQQYEALLRERDVTLQYVIDTDVHVDRISGARALRAAHGTALCLHESARLAYPFRPSRTERSWRCGNCMDVLSLGTRVGTETGPVTQTVDPAEIRGLTTTLPVWSPSSAFSI